MKYHQICPLSLFLLFVFLLPWLPFKMNFLDIRRRFVLFFSTCEGRLFGGRFGLVFFIAWICVIHISCFYPSHPYFVCHIQSLTICIISRLGGFGLFFHFDRLSPTWGNDPNFTSIVSNGCFNHQVVLGSS